MFYLYSDLIPKPEFQSKLSDILECKIQILFLLIYFPHVSHHKQDTIYTIYQDRFLYKLELLKWPIFSDMFLMFII